MHTLIIGHKSFLFRVVVHVVKYERDPDKFFNGYVEQNKYYEHTVFTMLAHNPMNKLKFKNFAILMLTEPIELNIDEGISAACYPR